jgi:hypothetical protein
LAEELKNYPWSYSFSSSMDRLDIFMLPCFATKQPSLQKLQKVDIYKNYYKKYFFLIAETILEETKQ